MDSSRRTLSDWLQFLLEAGIPASQAANYAVSFVENRIEKDMLGDLDKDYLKELGVTVLGDVISILKHAKKVAAQQNKRAEIQMVRTADGVKKSTPASRLVDHFLKGSDSAQSSPMAMAVDDDEDVVMESTPLQSKSVRKRSKLRSDQIPMSSATVSSTVKRRRVAPPVVTDKLKEEVPVQKKRRVLPEHEGGYKIKMPSGSIPKTAKLIAQGKISTKSTKPVTKGVFSRLGDSQANKKAVTKSDPQIDAQITKANIVSAQSNKSGKQISFTVTGLGKVDPQHILDSMKKTTDLDKGVFRRLGGGSTPPARRTIKRAATSTQSDEPIALDATPYIGVLKDGGKHATPKRKLKLAPSAADKTGFAASRLSTENVKTRLGVVKTKTEPTLTRTISTSSSSNFAVSIKRRLGSSSDSTVSSSTDRSSSAVKVATKLGQVTQPRRVAKQTVTIGGGDASGVFSRLGSR